MTRQIALGAVIAFAVTVLVLSVWEPKPPVAAVPPPPAPAEPAPAPAPGMEKPFHPATLRPEGIARMVKRPSMLMLQMIDAGTPAP
jgi:hypothetical protein